VALTFHCPKCLAPLPSRGAPCAECAGAEVTIDIGTGAPKREARSKRAPKERAPREPKPENPRPDRTLREQQRKAERDAKALAAESRRMDREAAQRAKAAALQSRRTEREAAKAAKAAARRASEDQIAGLGALMGIVFLILAGVIVLGSGR
jgi:hypothetical protein